MGVTPSIEAAFLRHFVEKKAPDLSSVVIPAATTDFLQQLAHVIGHGVVPGTPPVPEFTVKFPTMEERAQRRADRRKQQSENTGTDHAGYQSAH